MGRRHPRRHAGHRRPGLTGLPAALAAKGWRQACADDASLALGVNTHGGHLVNAAVGEATGLDTVTLEDALATGA